MKIHMYMWVGGIKNLPSWFKHGEQAEVSLNQIIELYNTGNNIMLSHTLDDEGKEMALLAVDNKRFTQR